jgi:hypothetical protein
VEEEVGIEAYPWLLISLEAITFLHNRVVYVSVLLLTYTVAVTTSELLAVNLSRKQRTLNPPNYQRLDMVPS